MKSSATAGKGTQGSFTTGTIHENQSFQEPSDQQTADADTSVFMSYAATRGDSFIGSPDAVAFAGGATSPPCHISDSQLAAALSYRKSHMRPMLSRKYSGMKSKKSGGLRLQPSATLQRMETNNAWWELHGEPPAAKGYSACPSIRVLHGTADQETPMSEMHPT